MNYNRQGWGKNNVHKKKKKKPQSNKVKTRKKKLINK